MMKTEKSKKKCLNDMRWKVSREKTENAGASREKDRKCMNLKVKVTDLPNTNIYILLYMYMFILLYTSAYDKHRSTDQINTCRREGDAKGVFL